MTGRDQGRREYDMKERDNEGLYILHIREFQTALDINGSADDGHNRTAELAA